MGVIKAKNSAGEWVSVASAEATTIHNELIGDLKVAYEVYTYGNRKNYIDLSKYVGVGNDFIIFPSIAVHANDGAATRYYWRKSLGGTKLFPQGTPATSKIGADALGDLFDITTPENISIEFDENTRILTLTDDTYHYFRDWVIIYAGIKEA